MKYGIVTLVAAAALLGVAPASAQLVAHHPAHATVRQIESSQKQNLAHARYLCNRGAHWQKRWGCQAVKWLTRELNETEAVLHPPVTASSHYQGWECIHGGEGDSASGTYTGYLQMTTPWEGMSYNWHAMGRAVYSIADRVAAAHKYDYNWMRGQWPNTYPPCSHYFN